MTSRIVHSYFFRFRLIRREIRHFVFRIGSYETGKACSSAISLRVAAKTRTKPTGAPSTVYRTNMPLTMANCRFDIFVISSLYKPLHCYHGRYADRLIRCLSIRRSKQTLELYHDQIPTRGGNGLERNRRQLLREDSLRNQRFSISREIRRYIRETNHYSIVDMEDIRYTIRQGRYSDKQTSKRSFPIPALV